MTPQQSVPVILLLLFLIVPPALASGQAPPSVAWEQTYSLGLSSQALDVVLTADGGYAIAGITLISDSRYNPTSYDLVPQNTDAFLIRTDAMGNELWARTYGNITNDGAYAVKETLDGGFILAGYTSDPERLDADRFLVRTDSVGNVIWEKHYNTNPGFDALHAVCALPDGNFLMTGETDQDQNYGARAGYLAEIDQNGAILWEKLFPGTYGEGYPGGVRSLDCASNEGYLLDIYGAPALVRTDARGDVIWSGYNDTILADARFATDGGAIVTGVTLSPTNRYPLLLLQKTDPTGRQEWTTPAPRNWSWGRAVDATSDGGFLAIGTTAIFSEEPGEIRANTTYNLGILLVRTDLQGNTLWTSTLSPAHYNEGIKVHETPDGGYIVLGTTADEAGLEYLLFLGNIPGKIYLAKLGGDDVTGQGNLLQTPSFTPTTLDTPVTTAYQRTSGAGVSPSAASTSQEIPLVFAPLLAILVILGVIWRRKR